MGWESFDVVRFDLEPLLHQMRTAKPKIAYNLLIIDPRGLQCETTRRKSWAENLLMLDLTFGPSFKVKLWFTGFGELSYGGYKFASVIRCTGQVVISVLLSVHLPALITEKLQHESSLNLKGRYFMGYIWISPEFV